MHYSGQTKEVTLIYEWGAGKLSNGGEKIELSMGGDLDDGVRYYIRLDRVVYGDVSPWPIAPDGTSDALDRVTDGTYGNDVINWQSVTPSPGS